MNFADLLMNSMTSDSSVEALSQKTGSSTKQTSSLLSLAIPILIKFMTQNASSESGAASLANALTQHTDTSSMVQQFTNADTQDGNAIIGHILGNDSSQVVNVLAEETETDNGTVSNLLGNMAPALLSGLSAATSSAQNNAQSSDGFDFSDLIGAFGGGQQTSAQQSGGSGMLESLLGMGSGSSSGSGGSSSLLGSLLGMGSDSSDSVYNNSNNGTSLISTLMNFMK